MIMDIFHDMPGLPGLFVAGIFSAAMSSLSSGLNSLSAIALEDFIKPRMQLTETQTSYFMRGFIFLCGILAVGLVFVIEQLGTTVFQLTLSFEATTNGPLFGIFVMGLMMPWIRTKCALNGGIIGVILMTLFTIKTQLLSLSGKLPSETQPVSIEGCTYDFDMIIDNSTMTIANEDNSSYVLNECFVQYK